jgi:DNA-binding LacI/PurR family transcriptional regulator
MGRPSVRQLATAIGVSPATVSRVLNEQPGVSDQTRIRVLVAVRELGYPAPSLPGRQAPLIGIIIPEPDNPIFPLLAAATEMRLARRGINALIASSATPGAAEQAHIDTCLRHGAHGLVLVSSAHTDPRRDHSRYRRLAGRGLVMVLVNGFVEGLRVPSVCTDEAAGAALAVHHLHSLGHRRIGLANGEAYLRQSVNRLAGFRHAMTDLFGRRDEQLVAATRYSIAGGYLAAQRLLTAGATAIVAGSDLMAIGAMRGAREQGRRVPTDVSVVGYDDTYLAALTEPPLTTVHQPLDLIAMAITSAIWQQLHGHRMEQLRFVATPTLVVRGSTAARGDP